MKQIIIVFAALMMISVSCNNAKQSSAGQADIKSATETVQWIDVDTLLSVAESHINKPIIVHGFVTHTCKHAGKRCFITGEDQKYTIRVEAKGDIGGFNRELVGSKLSINGILKERRLTQTEIADMESGVNEKMKKEDGSAETCAAELANINQMKDWMKEHGKDYYSIYFIDGTNYEVLDES
ncbi:MAG: hypothetical protein LBQ60_13725 [Bacteroidales bacterium]|jgi:hypothetical protein|nr:hypothetical protein [Bacteroidales bacterium]